MLVPACLLVVGSLAAWPDVPESEPNDNKSQAQSVALAPGDSIVGWCSGSLLTGAGGGNSADCFLISTPALPGITRYRLTVTTDGPAGHTLSLRGLNQSNGIIQTGDIAAQTGTTTTDPARSVWWYAFGPDVPRVHVRLTGASTTTGAYRLELFSQAVQPTPLPGGPLPAGTITITTRNQGHATNTDLWVIGPDGRAIPEYGNDESAGFLSPGHSTLTRTYTRGRYIVAVSQTNLAVHLPSPADDGARSGNVMDFPGVLATSSPTASVNLSTAFSAPGHARTVALGTAAPFSIAFVSFTVGGCGPADVATEGAASLDAGPDGFVTGTDFDAFILAFFSDHRLPSGTLLADITDGDGIGPPDGFLSGSDFDRFVLEFFVGCT